MSKRVTEEIRKKQDEQATAEIYNDFVSSFTGGVQMGKTFVRGEVVNAQPDKISSSKTTKTGELYRPNKLNDLIKPKIEEPKLDKLTPAKKVEKGKKKSNLQLFKEELQKIQEERQERNKMKQELRQSIIKGGKIDPVIESLLTAKEKDYDMAYGMLSSSSASVEQWENDPTTTNLFLANLNPKINEEKLCELFGKYGPLASVKIMWPRTEEEIARNRNCGFVAYMSRTDGEQALEKLKGIDVMGYEMKLGWGKPVPIPPHPVYIPPHLIELTLPPPPSGLPFNAQLPPNAKLTQDPSKHGQKDKDENYEYLYAPAPNIHLPSLDPELRAKFEKTLKKCVVRVVIPTERPLLCLIHRMIEFVVREGPRFEAMIMNRELKNPMFRFLFDNRSPAHIYYRWKLFSILNGETPTEWRTKRFRLFKAGSYWKPPSPYNMYNANLQHLVFQKSLINAVQKTNTDFLNLETLNHSNNQNNHKSEDDYIDESRSVDKMKYSDTRDTTTVARKDLLSTRQRNKLEHMLRRLNPARESISNAMLFCVDHAESASEIVRCLRESLSLPNTPLNKKLARVYLISDLLHNCSSKAPNASYFRKNLQKELPSMFRELQKCYKSIGARLKAELFKHKIVNCLKVWEEWDIFPGDFIYQLQNIFLGLQLDIDLKSTNMIYKKYQEPLLSLFNNGNSSFAIEKIDEDDIEGIPMSLDQLNELSNHHVDITSQPIVEGQGNNTQNAVGIGIYDDINDQSDTDEYPINSSALFKADTAKSTTLQNVSRTLVDNIYNDVDDEDIDGQPLNTAELNIQLSVQTNISAGTFVKSKWEEVDETTLESQVMTTSKWETLEESEEKYATQSPTNNAGEEIYNLTLNTNSPAKNTKAKTNVTEHDSTLIMIDKSNPLNYPTEKKINNNSTSNANINNDGNDIVNRKYEDSTSGNRDEMSEEKRNKLREIELKVMEYQDELEATRQRTKQSTQNLVEAYRNKLLSSPKTLRILSAPNTCKSEITAPQNSNAATQVKRDRDRDLTPGTTRKKEKRDKSTEKRKGTSDDKYPQDLAHKEKSSHKHRRQNSRSPKKEERSNANRDKKSTKR